MSTFESDHEGQQGPDAYGEYLRDQGARTPWLDGAGVEHPTATTSEPTVYDGKPPAAAHEAEYDETVHPERNEWDS